MSANDSLQTLRQRLAAGVPTAAGDDASARRQWWAALTVVQELLLEQGCQQGLWLAAPLPALHEPLLISRFHGWVWTPPQWSSRAPELPGSATNNPASERSLWQLPLQASDGTDPLLLLITGPLQVAMALHGSGNQRQLLVRFEQPLIAELLQSLGNRLASEQSEAASDLKHQIQQLGSLENSPQLAEQFWPRVAAQLAKATPSLTLVSAASSESDDSDQQLGLLEAIAHEVRTPLATIRTLIRSLQRRPDLSPQLQKRLGQIDHECSEQIDRFGLIFQAAELQRQPSQQRALARTDLGALLPGLEQIWQRQLQRRELRLELEQPNELPAVMSDPVLLESMLIGLMDRFSRGLRRGESVRVELASAGEQLKLRFSGGRDDEDAPGDTASVGPVLSWDPATGSLQLSQAATQKLFSSLGGRLTERPGSSLTLYLPLANVEGCEENGF